MTRAIKYPWVAISATTIALMIASVYHPAHAAVDPPHSAAVTSRAIDQAAADANRRAMAACHKLPVSQRGICKDRAGYSEAVMRQPESAAIDPAASATTRSEMAACKKLPVSQRGICADQAGYGQPVMSHSLSLEQHRALAQENARYKAAVAACNRMPVSDRTICVSQAGTADTLVAMK